MSETQECGFFRGPYHTYDCVAIASPLPHSPLYDVKISLRGRLGARDPCRGRKRSGDSLEHFEGIGEVRKRKDQTLYPAQK